MLRASGAISVRMVPPRPPATALTASSEAVATAAVVATSPDPPPDSFERLVEEHYRPAYRFALSLSGNHDDACDIAQQAFAIAHQRLHQVREPTKQKQWLFKVLYREFLRLRRREVAHPKTTLEFSEHELPRIHVDHAASLDGEAVLLALRSLDENFRLPVTLFYLNQLSYKEIAAALDIPIGTVMSRLARGKQMLRQRLEDKRAVDATKIVALPRPEARGGTDG